MKPLLIILALFLCVCSLAFSNPATLSITTALWAVVLMQLAVLCDKK